MIKNDITEASVWSLDCEVAVSKRVKEDTDIKVNKIIQAGDDGVCPAPELLCADAKKWLDFGWIVR